MKLTKRSVTNNGPLCIGMPLLFLVSTTFLILGKKWKQGV